MEIIIILVAVALGLWWFAFRKKPESLGTTYAPYKVETTPEPAPVATPVVESAPVAETVVATKPKAAAKKAPAKTAAKAKPKAKPAAKKPKAKPASQA